MRTQLKFLISVTIALSFLAAIFPSLTPWLTFSGLTPYAWKFFTYVLVEPGPFSLNFFLNIGFDMYILYLFGSSIIERMRPISFFSLYFGSALIASLATLPFPHPVLAGSSNAVLAILVAWMMLNPGSRLLLFFAVPFKVEWLIGLVIFLNLAVSFANSDWVGSTALMSSILFSYLFSIIVFKEQGPFTFLRPFERKLLRLFEKKPTKPYQRSKIYDIQSGAPILDDEQFMDAMLEKISRLGERSLTEAEKKRMDEISQKKK